nr:RHS repeat-associated core domain-containing protein [Burkholderia sp. BCC0405]
MPERNETTNPIRFQGQYHDDETGLHYNRYRYYDPNSGRFVSKDPIGLAGSTSINMRLIQCGGSIRLV